MNLIYAGTSYPLAAGTALADVENTIAQARNLERGNGVPAIATFATTTGSVSINVDSPVPLAFTS